MNSHCQVAMRGNPNDFDRWANESGDPQWTHKKLLPFFKKMETYRGDYFPIGTSEVRQKLKKNPKSLALLTCVKVGNDAIFF